MTAKNLSIIAQRHFFAEKILVCPSFISGHQMLENLTREGGGFSWLNFKVKTVQALARELVQEHICRSGLKIISPIEAGFFIDEIFSGLAQRGKLKYFERQIINTGIIKAITSGLAELKYAGLKPEMLKDSFFINPR
ncbi:MAG: hypothetical protein JW997_04865, partial [Actinobacteria bacterium]|nr:hypothetical protein [Actinomycetota bacterium]